MRIDQEMNEILRQQSNRTILLDNKTSEWQVKKNKDNAPPTEKSEICDAESNFDGLF